MQLWVGLVQTSQLVSRHWRSAASPPSWRICGGLLDPQNAVDGLDGRFILRTSLVWSKYCNQRVQRNAIMIYSTEAGASQGMFERQLETQTLCPWIWSLTDGRTVSVLLFHAMFVWCFESHVGIYKKTRPFNHIFGGDRILRAWHRGIKNAGPRKRAQGRAQDIPYHHISPYHHGIWRIFIECGKKPTRARAHKGEAQGVLSYQKATGIFDNPRITQGQCSYSRLAVTCRTGICALCGWVGVDGWISVPLRTYGTYVVNPVDLWIDGDKPAIKSKSKWFSDSSHQ